jgi:hypothetical protein
VIQVKALDGGGFIKCLGRIHESRES